MEDNQLLIHIADDGDSTSANSSLSKEDSTMINQDQDSLLFFRNETNKQPVYYAVVGVISLFIAVSLVLVSGLLYGYTGRNVPFDYGIVIDCGSTHTETFLYNWLGSKDHGTGDVAQNDSCTFSGGIDTLTDPTAIVECAVNVSKTVPTLARSSTPLYLGATAGMRLLRKTEPQQAKLIILALKYALKQVQADVKFVDIIEGFNEGISAWITVNFLLKTLTAQHYSWLLRQDIEPWNNTYGALDMGGASTQIAFAIDPVKEESYGQTSDLTLYGHKYSLFSHSFLCFGSMQAFRRHQAMLIKDLNSTQNIIDPCLPKGNFSVLTAEVLGEPCTLNPEFESWLEIRNHSKKEFTFEGTSDYESCKASVDDLFNSTLCNSMEFEFCPEKLNYSISNRKFIAVSSYYYMAAFLNSTNATLPEFIRAVQKWCNLTWEEIKEHEYKKSDLSHLTQYCFGSLYVIDWLIDIYGFDNNTWENIIFQQEINETEVGWTLGYMINATNAIPEQLPIPPVIPVITFILISVCTIPVAIIGIVFLRKYFKSGYHYSQLKYGLLVES